MNINSTKTACGDPWPFNGPQQVWVGDFPPGPSWVPYKPVQEFTPIPQTIIPLGPPGFDWNSTMQLALPRWRTSWDADVLTAEIDLPGVRPEWLEVDIVDNAIKVVVARFETNFVQREEFALPGNEFDPSSAEATLEFGVLTVTLKRFKEKRGHKVTVTAK